MLGRILVVDDNELVRESYCDVLRHRGYNVVEANDGEQAMEKISSEEIDLAIVDIMMPIMGGLELRQTLMDRNPPLPTILVTGKPDTVAALVEDDLDFQSGRVSVLQKPVHPVKLLAEVGKHLS